MVKGDSGEMKNIEENYRFFTLFPRIIKDILVVDKRYIVVSSFVTVIQSLAPALSLLIMQQIVNSIRTTESGFSYQSPDLRI